jgi:hypothetical protein
VDKEFFCFGSSPDALTLTCLCVCACVTDVFTHCTNANVLRSVCMCDCVMYVCMHVCAVPLIEGLYYEVPATRGQKKERFCASVLCICGTNKKLISVRPSPLSLYFTYLLSSLSLFSPPLCLCLCLCLSVSLCLFAFVSLLCTLQRQGHSYMGWKRLERISYETGPGTSRGGPQFSTFTSINVQILTQTALLRAISRGGSQLTCFTSTKVQILTQEALLRATWAPCMAFSGVTSARNTPTCTRITLAKASTSL